MLNSKCFANFKRQKMQRKTALHAVTIALILTITATLINCVPAVFAAIGKLPSGAEAEIPSQTWAFLYFRPNPIGVGQELLINGWTSPPPHRYEDLKMTPTIPGESISNGVPRTGYWVNITKPDGTVVNVGPLTSDGPGTFWFTYTVDQPGKWTLQFSWAGDKYFKGCSTEKQELIVQKDPVPSWPASSLPNEPWTYPINYENREWAQISGPWLTDSYSDSEANFNAYSQAPASSHILWKLPPLTGVAGLIGGEFGTTGLYTRSSLTFNCIMAGRAYASAGNRIYCYDIRTGESLWNRTGSFDYGDIRGTTAGATIYGGSTTGRSGTPSLYSFSNRFIVYDGITGAVTLNVTGMDVFGYVDPCAYSIEFHGNGTNQKSNLIKWWTNGTTNNFASRIVWNISNTAITFPRSGETGDLYHTDFWGNDLMTEISYSIYGESFGLNTTTGQVLWKANLTNPIWPTSGGSIGSYNGMTIYPAHVDKLVALDMKTGNVAWTSEQTDYPWGCFWAYSHCGGYGLVIRGTYDGVYAFNATNGEIVWHFNKTSPYSETPYGTWPFYGNPVMADGKFYMSTGEHSPTLPILRGQRFYCLDAFTGKEIWSIMGYGSPSAVAEGTLFQTDTYSATTYAFAKGQTETTVSVQNDVYTKGNGILIKGTVLDLSPAQPNTPAISDDSMSAWMEYLHKQQPKLTNATGVEIKLTAIDSNGNEIDIDTVTSDSTGSYKKLWTPTDEGEYTIKATFEGSMSYYSSSAETAIGITAAPSPSAVVPTISTPPSVSPSAIPEKEAQAIPTTNLYILIAAAIVIIAVVVVAVLLHRRK